MTYLGSLIVILFVALAVPVIADCPPQFALTWGNLGGGQGQFNGCYRIDTDAVGDVYVPDSFNYRVQRFTANGEFLGTWGVFGNGDGQFNYPTDVAVRSDTIYVTDFYNSRIQMFTTAGTFLTKWGSYGIGNGQFQYASGVTTDEAGHVYATDWYNCRVQKFTSDGTFLVAWGQWGQGPGEFDYPTGLSVDAAGNIYVADGRNDRVQKFTNDGVFLAQIGSSGLGDGQFDGPQDVEVDLQRSVLYVADTANDRIQMLTLDGAFLCSWGSTGTVPGNFTLPLGVAVDATGNVYVSDRGNNRIQLFASPLVGVDDSPGLPALAVYPNPFESVTTIKYTLSAPSRVHAAVFDVTGRLIRSLVNDRQSRGEHTIGWNGGGGHGEALSTGLYFVQVKTDAGALTRKVILIR